MASRKISGRGTGMKETAEGLDVTGVLPNAEIDQVKVVRNPVWVEAGLPNINDLGVSGKDKILAKMEAIKNRVIEKLKEAAIPWRHQFLDGNAVKNGKFIFKANPKSIKTGKPYTGLNSLKLRVAMAIIGYKSNWFGTAKQWLEKAEGLYCLKGTHTVTCFAPCMEKAVVRDPKTNLPLLDDKSGYIYKLNDKGKPIYEWNGNWGPFHVMNLDDLNPTTHEHMDLLEQLKQQDVDKPAIVLTGTELLDHDNATKFVRCAELDNLPQQLGCKFVVDNNRKAFYNPEEHSVHMPDPMNFRDGKAYYAVLLHECVHATSKELKRPRGEWDVLLDLPNRAYCREELVAEFACMCLQSMLGMSDWEGGDQFENSTAYIQGWLEGLQSDGEYLNEVMLDASRAANFIIKKLSASNKNIDSTIAQDVEVSEADKVQYSPYKNL